MISEKGLELNGRKGRILQWNPEKGTICCSIDRGHVNTMLDQADKFNLNKGAGEGKRYLLSLQGIKTRRTVVSDFSSTIQQCVAQSR